MGTVTMGSPASCIAAAISSEKVCETTIVFWLQNIAQNSAGYRYQLGSSTSEYRAATSAKR